MNGKKIVKLTDRSVIDVSLDRLNALVVNISQIRTLWEEHSNQSNPALNGSFILLGVRRVKYTLTLSFRANC